MISDIWGSQSGDAGDNWDTGRPPRFAGSTSLHIQGQAVHDHKRTTILRTVQNYLPNDTASYPTWLGVYFWIATCWRKTDRRTETKGGNFSLWTCQGKKSLNLEAIAMTSRSQNFKKGPKATEFQTARRFSIITHSARVRQKLRRGFVLPTGLSTSHSVGPLITRGSGRPQFTSPRHLK